jgi:apolipoprotein N-acyltransferase
MSFPKANLYILAWIGLVPLLFAIDGLRPRKAFVVSYICGVAFFLGTVYWLIHVTLPGMIIVVLYLAGYFGVFGLVFSGCRLRPIGPGWPSPDVLRLLLAPSLWTSLEWLRASALTGFGWALIGHSQAGNLPVIQAADTCGAYGVSFLIIFVNAAIFLTLKDFSRKEFRASYIAAAATLVFMADAYGITVLKSVFHGERIGVAVVQGNIPQREKWDRNFREGIIAKYERLTKEVSAFRPDLVVWPETSVPAFMELERGVSERIGALVADLKVPVLVGAPSVEKSGAAEIYYNSAILFSPDGRFSARYDKIHLVPFGEYVPFKRALSFVERFAPSPIGDFSGGRNYTVFSFFLERHRDEERIRKRLYKNVKFSCLICFEDIFPELARQFVRRGALFLVNITNDAWFGDTSAAYQHAQSSVFRAVENRVPVIRAANTGYSCIIDQKGEIVASVGSPGRELFVDGAAVGSVALARTSTFYGRNGDVFAYGCLIVTAVFIFAGASGFKQRGEIA